MSVGLGLLCMHIIQHIIIGCIFNSLWKLEFVVQDYTVSYCVFYVTRSYSIILNSLHRRQFPAVNV